MANLTITATNIVPVSGYAAYDGISGATITAGVVTYLDSSTNTLKIADANDTAAIATVKGIALHAATANQPLRLIVGGDLDMGAILTRGTPYWLSNGAGLICDVSTLVANDYVVLLGIALSTTRLRLNIMNTAVQVP